MCPKFLIFILSNVLLFQRDRKFVESVKQPIADSGSLYRQRRVVLIGPSKQIETHDFSKYISDDDIIVRINLKVTDGSVFLPPIVAAHTTNRTDVVCHHSSASTDRIWKCPKCFNSNVRKEDALESYTVLAYEKHGITQIICAEPFRCRRVHQMETDHLKISGMMPSTIAWSRGNKFSTGLKCIKEMLAHEIRELVIVGLDFHSGGTNLSYFSGYNELALPEGLDASRVTVEEQSNGHHNFTRELRKLRKLVFQDPRIRITEQLQHLLLQTETLPERRVVIGKRSHVFFLKDNMPKIPRKPKTPKTTKIPKTPENTLDNLLFWKMRNHTGGIS
mmetsp:Transcript_9030/g.15512  ORF Transcript_9030/g.15512 Transcript_9030/m.15512 type:complete len:333 (+) Transcript_9030:93-1091(+)